ncbi:MAG: hypothetical protein LBV33_04540, partial [Lachnospiraceae bacterium]|nr:hypothetical protein [Lachnospiraceae bacterium]
MSTPDIYSFQYDKLSNGILESNINMYRGAVCFDYNIISLSQHNGIGISVNTSYHSDSEKSILLSNTESPTGILGYGFSLTYEKIGCNPEDWAKSPECRSHWFGSGDANGGEPLHLDKMSGGRLFFENELYDYTETVYDPVSETWTVTDPDGIIYKYGGAGGLQYGVVYDDRYTKVMCADISGQRQVIKAWNLTEIISPHGNFVQYRYKSVMQPVTPKGQLYTKAVYIDKIIDSFGNQVKFHYGDKVWSLSDNDPREYGVTYQAVADDQPDFRQSEYETLYLSEIVVSNQAKNLYRASFSYTLENYAVEGAAWGNTVKRMLRSISLVTEKGIFPGMEFEYNQSGQTNPGILRAIRYPQGGRAHYLYRSVFLSQITAKIEAVSNNAFAGEPLIRFGNDYAVVIQKNAEKAIVSVYQWIGRWQQFTPDTDFDGVDPDSIAVTTQMDYAVVSGVTVNGRATNYMVLTKRRKVKGGWFAEPIRTTPDPDAGIITGSGWMLIHDKNNDILSGYYYDAPAEEWLAGHFPDETGEDGYTRLTAVGGNRLLCFYYDEDGGGYRNFIRAYECNALKEWNRIAEVECGEMIIQGGTDDGDYRLAFDGSLAAVALVNYRTGTNMRYSLGIWRLHHNILDNELQESLSLPVTETDLITPRIAGNTVISAGYLYRFGGDRWLVSDRLAIKANGSFQFALSENIALASSICNNRLTITAAVFDDQSEEWEEVPLSVGKAPAVPSHGVSI